MSGERWGNCLIAALAAWARHPLTTRLRAQRNKAGRWHIYWHRGADSFEFYAPGRSLRTYLQNALYRGRIRKMSGESSGGCA